MSFFNKFQLPPELQNLSPEEMVAFVAASKDKDVKLAEALAAKTTAETAAAGATTQVTAGREAVDKLKKLREAGLIDDNGDLVQRSVSGNGNGNAEGEGNKPVGFEDFFTDPITASQKANAGTTMLAMVAAKNSARMMAEMSVQNMTGKEGQIARKVWKKYAGEIQQLVDREPPLRQCDASVWMMALTHIQGTKFHEILNEVQTAGDQFFVEGVTSSGSGSHIETPNRDDILTDEEKRAAKKYGIPEAQYLKQKKSMTFGPALS